jgi:hypothetical protein
VADLLEEYANVARHFEANYMTDAVPGEDVQTQPVIPAPANGDNPTASRPSNVVE